MTQFRSIAQALEKGYKITSVSYQQSFDEWCIMCERKENGHIVRTSFWRRTFPKYLKWRDFKSERANKVGMLEMTLTLSLENK